MKYHYRTKWSLKTWLAVLISAILSAACASPYKEMAKQDMGNAQLTISEAEQKDAREHAALELGMANEKLADAKKAFQDEDYKKADFLAEEAMANAKLAGAKADTAKTQQVVQELKESIEMLRKQIERDQKKLRD